MIIDMFDKLYTVIDQQANLIMQEIFSPKISQVYFVTKGLSGMLLNNIVSIDI